MEFTTMDYSRSDEFGLNKIWSGVS